MLWNAPVVSCPGEINKAQAIAEIVVKYRHHRPGWAMVRTQVGQGSGVPIASESLQLSWPTRPAFPPTWLVRERSVASYPVGMGHSKKQEHRLIDAGWLEKMEELELHAAVMGDISQRRPRVDHEHGDPSFDRLTSFVQQQRKRRSLLTPEQVARLERLPGFRWRPNSEAWNALLADFERFNRIHGRQPSAWSDGPRERRLGQWVAEQKQLHRGLQGRRPLSPERIRQLEALPGWTWLPVGNSVTRRLETLASFISANGHVPKSRRRLGERRPLTEDERNENSLAAWVSLQMTRARKGELDSARIAELEEALGQRLT